MSSNYSVSLSSGSGKKQSILYILYPGFLRKKRYKIPPIFNSCYLCFMLKLLSLVLSVLSLIWGIRDFRKIKKWAFALVVVLVIITAYDCWPTVREILELVLYGVSVPWDREYLWGFLFFGGSACFPFPVYPNGGLWSHPRWYSCVLLLLNASACILLRRSSK